MSRSLRILRAAVAVRPGEMRALLTSFGYFFTLLFGYYVLRPVRDEMGVLSGAGNLQWLFTATFVAMLVAVPLYSRAVARLPRQRFVALTYRFFAANLALFAVALHLGIAPARLAQALFVWISVYNLFVVSVFWSVMADIFRSEQGKRLFGFIAAGGTVGQIAGSWATSTYAQSLGIAGLLLISLVLLEVSARCAGSLLRHATPAAPAGAPAGEAVIGGSAFAGMTRVVRSPYLLGICFYILCLTTTATFLYFQRASIVERAFASSEERTAFFALMDMLVGLGTVLLQLLVTGRLITWLGIAALLACLPLLVGLGMASLALVPTLAVLTGFDALRRAANFALAKPARELLFTVTAREDRYKAKSFIDTVVYRGGDTVAGWAHTGLVALGLGLVGIALTAIQITAVWLVIARYLGRKQEQLSRAARARDDQHNGGPSADNT